MLSINTGVKSFLETQRVLEELKNKINEIEENQNPVSEGNESDIEGKVGSVRIIKNKENESLFEIKTDEGWKTPIIGKNPIIFKRVEDVSKSKTKKSIDELETSDSSTGDTKAKNTIYDEKNSKFILARPDYDSGWIEDAAADAAITVEHNLDIINFSLIDLQISNSSTGANATWLSITDADEGGYIIQVKDSNNIFVGTDDAGPPRFDCAGLTWQDEVSTHFRLRLWK